MTNTEKIVQLNYQLRQIVMTCKIAMTRGIANLHPIARKQVFSSVRTIDHFTEDNNLYREHDFGSLNVGEQKFFWKIDYYDSEYENSSETPWDENKTSTNRYVRF